MKKLLFLLLLFGCETIKYIPSESNYYGLDFQKYAEKDFLITPEMYLGKYMTLGIINYEIYPEANYVKKIFFNPDGTYYTKSIWISKIIIPSIAIDSMYSFCKQLGANAIVKFDIESIKKDYFDIINPISISGIKISGYAIKRID